MDCDCGVTVAGGVAFVTVRLRNPTPVARRLRVTNRLDGPVLPPRTAGVPDPGWDDAGVTVVVPPETTRPLGYACPLGEYDTEERAEPAAAVVADDRVASDPETTHEYSGDCVRDAVRDLGRPAPPRDAVPAPDADDRRSVAGRQSSDADTPPASTTIDSPPTSATSDSFPPALAAWLAGVERRVAAAEALDAATEVEAATATVAGLEVPPDDLADRLATDRRLAADLATRADRLAERAETASVPAEALRRLS